MREGVDEERLPEYPLLLLREGAEYVRPLLVPLLREMRVRLGLTALPLWLRRVVAPLTDEDERRLPPPYRFSDERPPPVLRPLPSEEADPEAAEECVDREEERPEERPPPPLPAA